MTSRDELREAIAADVLAMHYQGAGRAQREGKIVACSCGFDGNYVTWRRHVADAVLAVLDQQGWPDTGPARAEKRNLERQVVVMGVALDQAEAERNTLAEQLRLCQDALHAALAERDAALREVERLTEMNEILSACHMDDVAALREAARYEPIGKRLVWPSDVGTRIFPENYPTSDLSSETVYRRVTEGEEG